MTDRLTPAERSALMGRIQGGPRNRLQRSVHGWLCAKHVRHECEPRLLGAGRPDFAVHPRTGPRYPILLIFVDGCFWHGCPWHFRPPKTNAGYWRRHIAENVQRAALREGLPYPWVAYWEHGVTGAAGWPRGAYKEALLARIRAAWGSELAAGQRKLEAYAA